MRTAGLVLIALAVLMLLAACQVRSASVAPNWSPGVSSSPLIAATDQGDGFTRLNAAETGIDFANPVNDEFVSQMMYQFQIQSGVASGDYDNDGDLDVFLAGLSGPNKLYRNDGGFKFTDVTADAAAGLDGGDALGCSGAFADLDGDGLLDLYVCNHRNPNQLYMNKGTGRFVEEGAARGVDDSHDTISATVFDADNDGDLDLYLANYISQYDEKKFMDAMAQFTKAKYTKVPKEFADLVYLDDFGVPRVIPDRDAFLVNDGTGHFTDRTTAAGLGQISWTFQAQACDFNDDGWVDLYITSDFQTPDRLMINNGDGTFTDRAAEMTRKSPLFSMGCDSGDVNGDGLPDLFASDMSSRSYKRSKRQSGDMNLWRKQMLYEHPQPQMRNMLYVNRGGGWMTELAQYAGVTSSEWTWSTRILDLDCDGMMDIFTTSGMLRDVMDVDYQNQVNSMLGKGASKADILQYTLSQPSYMTDNFIFTEASKDPKFSPAPSNWNMLDGAMGCGASLADFDGDGDLDAIINNTNGEVGIWRNDFATGNRLTVDLRQAGANWEAVGARVWAHCGSDVYMRDVIITRGLATSESARLHFGIGKHVQVDKLEIRWPDGKQQVEQNLPAGAHYVIGRREGLKDWSPAPRDPVFTQAQLDWSRTEADLDQTEFRPEPLLPMLQNTLDGGAGVADYDLDGNLDIYVCGPAGEHGQLFAGDGKGGFTPVDGVGSLIPEECEEMAALWFEADGDGRPDLLITCGGMESEPNSRCYQDFLLLNKEKGFVTGQLPTIRTSTGAAAAADIDGDGDLDLVICGNVVRYKYGAPARNYVLENVGNGHFTEATDKFAPGINKLAQLTDVQFCDMNGDGPPDMLISQKWGPVELWTNHAGRLEKTNELTPPGWWQGLGIGDFDGDGDFDVVCANTGINTKYHPGDNKPVTMFAADFDDNGTRDLIEVKYGSDGVKLPGRGRSCSGYAIKYIPRRFPTWASFSNATLEDIYGAKLATAEDFEVSEMHSVLCLNTGDGMFEVRPLPGSAQWAPSFGVAVGDFNGDGELDCYLANNFYDTQPETGHWDTGYGVLLEGHGDGSFSPLDPWQSGIEEWHDGRCAVPADLNQDGALDLVLVVSSGYPQIELNNHESNTTEVTLRGSAGNPLGVGATVRLELSDGSVQMQCVEAGQGYLGSYAGMLHFELPEGAQATGCSVTWPDGSTSTAEEVRDGAVEVVHHGE